MLFFAPCGQPVMHAPQRTQSAKEIPCGVDGEGPGHAQLVGSSLQPCVLRARVRVRLATQHRGRRVVVRCQLRCPVQPGGSPAGCLPRVRLRVQQHSRIDDRPATDADPMHDHHVAQQRLLEVPVQPDPGHPRAGRASGARRPRGPRGSSRRPCSRTTTERPACAWRRAATPPPKPDPTTATSTSHPLTPTASRVHGSDAIRRDPEQRPPRRVPGMARIIVIGAGMGGMAAAARLKVKGHDVTVIEASDTHGGKLGTFRRDGFAFDTGPSLFTIPAVYRDLFLKTGGPLEDSVELVPLDPGFTYRFADGSTLRDARCGRRDGRCGDGRCLRRAVGRPVAGADGARGPDVGSHPPPVPRVAADRCPRPDPPGPRPRRRAHGRPVADAARPGARHADRLACPPGVRPLRHVLRVRIRAGRRPSWPRSPTSRPPSAPGTSPAGCAASATPCAHGSTSAG